MVLKKYKVAMITNWYYPESIGGIETYIETLAGALIEKGIEIIIAAPSTDEKEHHYDYKGLPVYRYPLLLKPSRHETTSGEDFKYFEYFRSWIKNEMPDVVHFHSMPSLTGLPYIQFIKDLSIPVVFTSHLPGTTCIRGTMMQWGTIPCDGTIKPERCAACYLHGRGMPRWIATCLGRLPRSLIEWFSGVNNSLGTAIRMPSLIVEKKKAFKEFFLLIDALIVLNKWQYKAMISNDVPRSTLFLVRHGVSEKKFLSVKNSRMKPRDFLRIGYVGRFQPEKGAHILIQAMRRIKKSLPVILEIYGVANSDLEDRYLKKLIKMSLHDHRIIFCGPLTSVNLKEVFIKLSVLAVPSIWFETGPLVALEALAAGTPVIGSNLGGIPEWIEDGVNGILVDPGNVDAWTKSIVRLLNNPRIVERLAKNAGPVRSMKDVAQEMIDIYDKVRSNKI